MKTVWGNLNGARDGALPVFVLYNWNDYRTMKDFWKQFPRPIVGLSPMDGFTDTAMRRITKEVCPDVIMFTEFTSAEGLAHDAEKIKARFQYNPEEQPIIAQIFGSDIPSFIYAAQWLEERGFAGIDINMGCPSRKVVKSECGIALRNNHDLAFQLVDAVATNTKLPVSIKTRLGLKDASDLLAFGKGCENAGANLITIHGRTYDEPYGVPAQFEHIYELKKVLSIPVLGNGGIASRKDGNEKLGNLDGFLIGQAATGNPWVFTLQPSGTSGAGFLENGNIPFVEKVPVILRHAQYVVELRGPIYGIREMRKHLLAYVKGMVRAKEYRQSLAHVDSLAAIEECLTNILSQEQRNG